MKIRTLNRVLAVFGIVAVASFIGMEAKAQLSANSIPYFSPPPIDHPEKVPVNLFDEDKVLNLDQPVARPEAKKKLDELWLTHRAVSISA